jgi:hypothetical protein
LQLALDSVARGPFQIYNFASKNLKGGAMGLKKPLPPKEPAWGLEKAIEQFRIFQSVFGLPKRASCFYAVLAALADVLPDREIDKGKLLEHVKEGGLRGERTDFDKVVWEQMTDDGLVSLDKRPAPVPNKRRKRHRGVIAEDLVPPDGRLSLDSPPIPSRESRKTGDVVVVIKDRLLEHILGYSRLCGHSLLPDARLDHLEEAAWLKLARMVFGSFRHRYSGESYLFRQRIAGRTQSALAQRLEAIAAMSEPKIAAAISTYVAYSHGEHAVNRFELIRHVSDALPLMSETGSSENFGSIVDHLENLRLVERRGNDLYPNPELIRDFKCYLDETDTQMKKLIRDIAHELALAPAGDMVEEIEQAPSNDGALTA